MAAGDRVRIKKARPPQAWPQLEEEMANTTEQERPPVVLPDQDELDRPPLTEEEAEALVAAVMERGLKYCSAVKLDVIRIQELAEGEFRADVVLRIKNE